MTSTTFLQLGFDKTVTLLQYVKDKSPEAIAALPSMLIEGRKHRPIDLIKGLGLLDDAGHPAYLKMAEVIGSITQNTHSLKPRQWQQVPQLLQMLGIAAREQSRTIENLNDIASICIVFNRLSDNHLRHISNPTLPSHPNVLFGGVATVLAGRTAIIFDVRRDSVRMELAPRPLAAH